MVDFNNIGNNIEEVKKPSDLYLKPHKDGDICKVQSTHKIYVYADSVWEQYKDPKDQFYEGLDNLFKEFEEKWYNDIENDDFSEMLGDFKTRLENYIGDHVAVIK